MTCRWCGLPTDAKSGVCSDCASTRDHHERMSLMVHPGIAIFLIWGGLLVAQLAILYCPLARVSIDCMSVSTGWAISVGGVLIGLSVLSAAWEVLPASERRTSPKRAIFFLLVPGFNLFWIFIAVWGFARDANSWLPHRLRHLKISQWLSGVLALLTSMSAVPGLGVYVAIPALIAYSVLLCQWYRFACAEEEITCALLPSPKKSTVPAYHS